MALIGKKLFGNGRGFSTLSAANPTPIRFGTMQDQSITFKRKIQEIHGEGQLAEDASSGTMSVTGKVTMGSSNARIAADGLFGNAGSSASLTKEADGESGTVAASSPYIVTVANSSTWTQDLGVVDVATGNRMVRVASAPVAGVSYMVSAGAYTFASGDEGAAKKIWYLYTVASAGEAVSMANQKQGKVGASSVALVFPWTSFGNAEEQDVVQLNAVLFSDYELSSKLEDYGKPPLSFTAFCDTTGTMGTLNFAEAA